MNEYSAGAAAAAADDGAGAVARDDDCYCQFFVLSFSFFDVYVVNCARLRPVLKALLLLMWSPMTVVVGGVVMAVLAHHYLSADGDGHALCDVFPVDYVADVN